MLHSGVFRQVALRERASHGRKQGQAAAFAKCAWAFVGALMALIVTDACWPVHAAEITENVDEKKHNAVHSAALAYDIRTHPHGKDYLFQMAIATHEMKKGTPAGDIARIVNAKSGEVQRALSGGVSNEGRSKIFSGLIKTYGSIPLIVLNKAAGAGLAIAGGADMVAGINDFVNTATSRKTRRMMTDTSRHKSVETVVGEFQSAFSQRSDKQEIHDNWNLMFPAGNPDLGPLQSTDDLITASPPLKQNRELLAGIMHSETAVGEKIDRSTKHLSDLVDDVREDIEEDIQKLGNTFSAYTGAQKAVWADFQNFMVQQEIARANLRQQQEEQIKIEGLRAAGYVLSTVIGFADKEAGEKLSAVVDFTFDLYDAVDTFEKVSGGFGDLTSFATAALTGDVLSAGLKLLGAFIDTGPTADEMILEEIGKLREQVEGVRREMHTRFDHVDARLFAIHTDLIDGMKKLEELINSNDRRILAELSAIRNTLEEHEKDVQDILRADLEQGERIIARLEAGFTEPCSLRRDIDPAGIGFGSTDFMRCLAAFGAVATGRVIEEDQTDIDSFLRMPGEIRDADRIANAAFQWFRDTSHDVSLPTSIVGPSAWFSLADRVDQLMQDWPKYTASVNSATRYGEQMERYREDLRTYVRALEDDYRKFRSGDESAIGALFAELRRGFPNNDYVDGDPLSIADGYVGDEDEYIDNHLRAAEYYRAIDDWDGRYSPWFIRDDVYADGFSMTGEFENYLREKTKFIPCGPDGKGENGLGEADECQWVSSDHPYRLKMLVGHDEGLEYIWERFTSGFEDNEPLTQMAAAGMIESIRIFYEGYLKSSHLVARDWDAQELTAEYEYGQAVSVVAVIEASCFRSDSDSWVSEDGYATYEGDRSTYFDSVVDIGPLFQFIDDESSWSYEAWREAFERWQREERGRWVVHVKPDSRTYSLYRSAARELGRDIGTGAGRVLKDCWGDIERSLKTAYAKLSDRVYGRMEEDETLEDYKELAQRYSIYLQSWLSLMLRDMTGRSRVAEAVVEGKWVLPTVDEVWKQVRADGGYAWELRSKYFDILDEFEASLRSPLFEQVVNDGAGDVDLMQTLFLGIDDLEPVNSASPTPVAVSDE